MRRTVCLFALLCTGVLSWFLLGHWLPGGAERFYLLVPPLFVAGTLLTSAGDGKGWKRQALRMGAMFGGLAFFGAAYGLVQLRWLSGGFSAGLSAAFFLEAYAAFTFLATACLLMLASRSVLRKVVHGLEGRIFPGFTISSRGHRFRLQACDLVVLLLILAFGIPYLLGALFVHRFKVSNGPAPEALAARPYDEVAFIADDGLTLRGWFIPALQPSFRSLVICHGLGANRTVFLPYVKVGDALEANVLLFDFRGHGDSDGHTVSLGRHERLDVLAAVRYLRTQRPEQAREVMGLGISMGASALTLAAAEVEPPLDAVILDSGFASAVDLADNVLMMYPGALRGWLKLPGIPLASLHAGCRLADIRPVDQVHALRAPLLIIHTEGDKLIPLEQATRLYEAAVEPKTIWIAPAGNAKAILFAPAGTHGAALFLNEEDYLRVVRKLADFSISAGPRATARLGRQSGGAGNQGCAALGGEPPSLP